MSCAAPRFPLLPLCGVALGLLVSLPVSAAKVYQWKDAQGVTHYTDLPPAGQHTTRTVGAKTATPAIAAKPAVNANCTNARGNLKVLEGNAPVGIDADKDGKPDSMMSPEQRAAQLQLAKAAIEVHCEASPISASAKKAG
ncbi:DUF4124 domain-containing protein [Cognatilysobacter bugurensis]|nr:DUF4124 domain-containing protein [Lysobacter bugurensis]